MNSSITTKLDELFAEWQLSCSHFVKDGIMLKPDTNIDVEVAWLHSERRIAFLLKDQNQGIGEHWDDDARLWPLYEGWPRGQMFHIIGAPDKPCGVGRADANPKLLLNDT